MKVVIISVVLFAATQAGVIQEQYGFPTGRVVGGHNAEPHSAPYIVSLQKGGNHFCAGSLIDPQWVVTAAHCMLYGASGTTVVAGKHNINRSEDTEQRRKSAKFHRHAQYIGGVGPYDIGLIRLEKPFDLNANVQPISLPESGKIHSGQVTLFGWGSTSTSSWPSYPSILQTVDKPIVRYNECKSALGLGSPLHPTNVCTGPLSGGISACSGDSGGPLVQQSTHGLELVGIVSWGRIPCGQRNAPSVYTRVSAHIAWIKEQRGGRQIMFM